MSMTVQIRVAIKGLAEFQAALEKARDSFMRLYWMQWWGMWGTNGWKRRTALVVVDR